MATVDESTGFDLRGLISYYIHELWQRRWVSLSVAWVICIAGLLFVARMPDVYESQTRIYVETQSLLQPLMQGLAVQSDPSRQLDFIRRTLLARPNLERLITETNLDLDITSLDPERRAREREALIEDLTKRITVSTDSATLFRIAYADRSPTRARDVTEGMLRIFREQNVSDLRSDLISSGRFIDGQIEEYEQRLRDSENQVAEFRRANADSLRQAQGAQERVSQLESQVQSLQIELQSAIWSRDQLRLQAQSVPRYMDEASGAAAMAAGPTEELSRCGQLVENRRIVLTSLTADHPTVRNIDRMIESMGCLEAPTAADTTAGLPPEALDAAAQAALGETGPAGTAALAGEQEALDPARPVNPAFIEVQEALRRLELGIASLQYRIEIFQTQLTEARQMAEDVPEVALRLQQMSRDYEAIRGTYNTLIQRRESARLARNIEDDTTSIEFRVVEPPILPLVPAGPNRMLLAIGVLIAGLGAGVGLSLGLIQLNKCFRTVNELRAYFDLPVLGSVTRLDLGSKRRTMMVDIPLAASSLVGLLLVTGVFIYLFHFELVRLDFGPIASAMRRLIS